MTAVSHVLVGAVVLCCMLTICNTICRLMLEVCDSTVAKENPFDLPVCSALLVHKILSELQKCSQTDTLHISINSLDLITDNGNFLEALTST